MQDNCYLIKSKTRYFSVLSIYNTTFSHIKKKFSGDVEVPFSIYICDAILIETKKRLFQRYQKHKNNRLKWHFNPPSVAYFGGVHKTMVTVAKRAMRPDLRKADIKVEELITAIIGGEATH